MKTFFLILIFSVSVNAQYVYRSIEPVRVIDLSNQVKVYDFGQELNGWVQIGFNHFEDTHNITVRYGETIDEVVETDDISEYYGSFFREETRQICPCDSNAFQETGFRFVRVNYGNAFCHLDNVTAIEKCWNLVRTRFETSDSMLNRIYDVAARTAELCVQSNGIWDGIKRDRMNSWALDVYAAMPILHYVFNADSLIRLAIESMRPNPGSVCNLATYKLWFILMNWRYFEYTNDKTFLASGKSQIYAILDEMSSHVDPLGIEQIPIPNRFLEWMETENSQAEHAGIQALYVLAFRAGAYIAFLFDDVGPANDYIIQAYRMRSITVNPNGNPLAASLMVLAGMADADSMNNSFLKSCPNITPVSMGFILEARSKAEDFSGCIQQIKDYYSGMLRLGASTFWEVYRHGLDNDYTPIDQYPASKPYVNQILDDFGTGSAGIYSRKSYCHIWSSTVAGWMIQQMLVNGNKGDVSFVSGEFNGKTFLRNNKSFILESR